MNKLFVRTLQFWSIIIIAAAAVAGAIIYFNSRIY